MTDARVTQAGGEALYSVLPEARVTQVGGEVLYQLAGRPFVIQIAWDPALTGPTRWAQPYADVSDHVLRCDIERSAGLPAVAADELRLRLQNDDLRYSAANTDSPLYGLLPIDPEDGRPVRVLGRWRGTVTPLFYGYLAVKRQTLSPTPHARTVEFIARSPLLRLAPLAAPLEQSYQVVPVADTGSGVFSVVPYAVMLANAALTGGALGHAEIADDVHPVVPDMGEPAYDVDESGIETFGPYSNFISQLQGLSAKTGGMYYVQPTRDEVDGYPYTLVWQALSRKEHAPNDWVLDESTHVGRDLLFEEKAPVGG